MPWFEKLPPQGELRDVPIGSLRRHDCVGEAAPEDETHDDSAQDRLIPR